jgi:hypothetical protein
MAYIMDDYDPRADAIRIPVMTEDQTKLLGWPNKPAPLRFEPRVPFVMMGWESYRAAEPFDVICLSRSPGFTPASADPLFEAIRDALIDETAF